LPSSWLTTLPAPCLTRPSSRNMPARNSERVRRIPTLFHAVLFTRSLSFSFSLSRHPGLGHQKRASLRYFGCPSQTRRNRCIRRIRSRNLCGYLVSGYKPAKRVAWTPPMTTLSTLMDHRTLRPMTHHHRFRLSTRALGSHATTASGFPPSVFKMGIVASFPHGCSCRTPPRFRPRSLSFQKGSMAASLVGTILVLAT
jgi:hypothetical protein